MRFECVLTTAVLTASAIAGNSDGLDVLADPIVGDVTVRLELVASGLSAPLAPINSVFPAGVSFPVDATALPDASGRMLVMTLAGEIYLLESSGSLTLFHDLVDPAITEIAPTQFGPVSILAHPNFATNGIFYTVETEVENTAPADFGGGSDHQDVLYEYTMNDPSANTLAASGFTKRAIIRINQPRWDHNLNDIAFLPDNTMLIAIGDGGNSNGTGTNNNQLNATRLNRAFGKVLRIDPLGSNSANGQYDIPADNPVFTNPNALPEVFTYGHRNPFRISVDPLTGEAWVGEVGQVTIEEINRLSPGGNFGWPLKEGSFLFGDQAGDANASGDIDNGDVAIDPDNDANNNGDFADASNIIDPVFEYDHGTGDSIAGGIVYRGNAVPGLNGQYIFGDTDFSEPGGLFYGPADATPVSGQVGSVNRFTLTSDSEPIPDAIVGFAYDPNGEVLILSVTGEILRISAPTVCPGDVDGDGRTTTADITLVVSNLGAGAPDADGTPGDADGNGVTTTADITFVVSNLGCQS